MVSYYSTGGGNYQETQQCTRKGREEASKHGCDIGFKMVKEIGYTNVLSQRKYIC